MGTGRFFSPRDVCQSLDLFLVFIIGKGDCYWHLMGRGHGYAEHWQCTRQTSTTKNYQAQNICSAKVEIPLV